MTGIARAHPAGIVFRWPRAYDLLLRLTWGRRERRYRDLVLEIAALTVGESVLDVGCGTGTLAFAAARRAGLHGYVVGVDASSQMVARARAKASAQELSVEFIEAPAQDLPFRDSSFDLVLSTTAIHCLPEAERTLCFREMARVLKSNGRLLIVDFGGRDERRHSVFGHLTVHRRYNLREESRNIADAGLSEFASGELGFSDLYFILAGHAGATIRGVGGERR